jgi:hypothetical protein
MKENAKTEQQLFEEQLQAVTGGCAQCLRDKAAATLLLRHSASREASALTHPDVNTRNQLRVEANTAQNDAMALLAGIRLRQQNPHHEN